MSTNKTSFEDFLKNKTYYCVDFYQQNLLHQPPIILYKLRRQLAYLNEREKIDYSLHWVKVDIDNFLEKENPFYKTQIIGDKLYVFDTKRKSNTKNLKKEAEYLCHIQECPIYNAETHAKLNRITTIKQHLS